MALGCMEPGTDVSVPRVVIFKFGLVHLAKKIEDARKVSAHQLRNPCELPLNLVVECATRVTEARPHGTPSLVVAVKRVLKVSNEFPVRLRKPLKILRRDDRQ